jgi:hypothetical protein
VVAVSSTGVLTSESYGQTTVIARYGTITSTLPVIVIADGTFIVTGTVGEVGLTIAGAMVTVLDGPAAGLAAVTQANGSYRLFGVGGPVTLRASQAGYMTITRTVVISANQVVDFTLTPLVAPLQVAGLYTLTLTASSNCSDRLPPEGVERRYLATVTQTGARADVELGEAEFAAYANYDRNKIRNTFSGRISGNTIAFTVPADDYYGIYGILEHVEGTRYFEAGGVAATTATPARIAGTLTGMIRMTNYASSPPGSFLTVLGSCMNSHGFVMVRR